MADFLNGYNDLQVNKKKMYEKKRHCAVIKAFICDAPARQFLKSIKSHNGYYGKVELFFMT